MVVTSQLTPKNKIPVHANLQLPNTLRLNESQVQLSIENPLDQTLGSSRLKHVVDKQTSFVRKIITRDEAANMERDSSRGIPLYKHSDASVDVVASTDALKEVFILPYNPAPRCVAIHRVGRQLVIGTAVESESRRISRRYKRQLSNTLTSFVPRATGSIKHLSHNSNSEETSDEYDMEPQFMTDPETGEIFLSYDVLQPHLEEIVQENIHHAFHDRYLHDALSRVSFPPELTMTECVPQNLLDPSSYQQLVRWQFNSMELLLGSNTMIFKHKETDEATGIRMHDEDQLKLTSLVCLDAWMENVMTNLNQTAFCFHRDGHVQGYQMVRTEDLPFVDEPALFDAHAVFLNAQAILSFLQENCVDESQTYWLARSPVNGSLNLFQLPNKISSTADHTVGMLCFELANSIVGTTSNDNRRAQRLYSKCIQLVDTKLSPEIVSKACLALGMTFLRPHIGPNFSLRLLLGEVDSCLRTKLILDELSCALDTCESSARKDGKHKIASLFEIAQRYIPTPSQASNMIHIPPPLLDDEAQEKEDIEQALVIFVEGLKHTSDESLIDARLLDGVIACTYVLAHFLIDELNLFAALRHIHTLLDLIPSYTFPQVNLLVAKVHLRLAKASNGIDSQKEYSSYEITDRRIVKDSTPVWVHMTQKSAHSWKADCEQHLNIAIASIMHVGTSKVYDSLPFFGVTRERIHEVFRRLLRDGFVSQARHFVSTGRQTKGARHAEQGLVLFSSIGDKVAAIEMRILLGEIALCHANQSSGYHKAIGAFNQALNSLANAKPNDEIDNEWATALQVHILLLLRLAHAVHALHLQGRLSNDSLWSVDNGNEWTAAQSAIHDELQQCLKYSETALSICPSSTRVLWRVADAHYLLACLYSSHLGMNNHQNIAMDTKLFSTCINHYNAALEVLPLAFDTCIHHLLLRLDMVKFLLSTSSKSDAIYYSTESIAQWLALKCLIQSAPLYDLRAPSPDTDDHQRIQLLLSGLFKLIEQQAHICMKQLIKMNHIHSKQVKRTYLIWIQHSNQWTPYEQLLNASSALQSLE